jgi:hypothetical protein
MNEKLELRWMTKQKQLLLFNKQIMSTLITQWNVGNDSKRSMWILQKYIEYRHDTNSATYYCQLYNWKENHAVSRDKKKENL